MMKPEGMIFAKRRIMIVAALVALCMLMGGCSKFALQQKVSEAPAASTDTTAKPAENVELPELSLTRTPGKSPDENKEKEEPKKEEKEKTATENRQDEITEDGIYHDLESVVLYYDKFGKLPSNFITKKEAKELGWEGGALDPYKKGASIGGDHFGNYEKQLPGGKGVKYIECDIDTNGGKRGAKRLIISNDGKYYYTPDHYETFNEVVIRDGKVAVEP